MAVPASLGCSNAVNSLMCSEEYQGISGWEDEMQSFDERQQHLHLEEYNWHDFVIFNHLLEEEDEVMELLMQKEASFMLRKEYVESYNGSDDTEMQESRKRAVYWMLTVQAYYGFHPCTAFLAVSYFDRFLANQQENLQKRKAPWLVQLIAVGCVSLAAKAEEIEVPLLLDLQVGHVPHVFEARTIQRMELLILSTLKWRLNSVTPFSFLGFLLQKMTVRGRSLSNLLPRVEELILNSCGDPRFVVYTPSVIATASVMCACDELLSADQAASCKHALQSVWPNRERSIKECAGLIQELIVGAKHPFWTSCRKMLASPNSSSAPESPNAVLDAACFSCESGNTTCSSSLVSAKSHVLHSSGFDCTSFSSTVPGTATYTSSLSPSVYKTIDYCRKRKFNECYSTIFVRTSRRAEPTE